MSLIDRGTGPSPAELKYFGLILAAFGVFIGALILYVNGSRTAAGWAAGIGGLFCVIYYAMPATRYLLYATWMAIVYPVGWLMSHLLMGVLYYVLISPIGILLRLTGRDALARQRKSPVTTYWQALESTESANRYFQQF